MDEHLDFMNPAVSIFEIFDNSMAPGIGRGDLLVYNKSRMPRSGATVIVDVMGEILCRKLMWFAGVPTLISTKGQSIVLTKELEHHFLGVVTWKLGRQA